THLRTVVLAAFAAVFAVLRGRLGVFVVLGVVFVGTGVPVLLRCRVLLGRPRGVIGRRIRVAGLGASGHKGDGQQTDEREENARGQARRNTPRGRVGGGRGGHREPVVVRGAGRQVESECGRGSSAAQMPMPAPLRRSYSSASPA